MSIASHRHAGPRVLLMVFVSLGLASLSACASVAPVPVVAFPTVSDPPTLNLVAPASTSAAPAVNLPPPGSVTTKILDISGAPLGRASGSWVDFTVTVANSSTYVYQNLAPLVVFGACTCDPGNNGLPPHSVLQIWDPTTEAWVSSGSVSTDTTGAYQFAKQVAFVNLGAKQTLTYLYRATLGNTSHLTGMRSGTGSIEVFVLQMPGHTRISLAAGPDASAQLGYELG
jgi:hypothetical protein